MLGRSFWLLCKEWIVEQQQWTKQSSRRWVMLLPCGGQFDVADEAGGVRMVPGGVDGGSIR